MPFEMREMTGSLWPNSYKVPGSNQPDETGSILMNGVMYKLASWTKTAESSGKSFRSLKLEEKQDAPTPPPPTPAAPDGSDGVDDDLPF